MKYLVVDTTNLLYKSYYVNRNEEDITQAGLAIFHALLTLNKHFKTFRPDKTILAFDRSSWRKAYTKSDLCLSQKLYKGNRRKDQTKSQKEKFQNFLTHMQDFENIMKTHTSIVCLASNLLEADDLTGGLVETYASKNNEIIIISSDKDYIQLLGHPNVRLIDPSTGKDRTLDEWQGDAKLFMFEKAIRGDAGDNVQSAYPRCRSTRIRKAYSDPLEYTNLMHETWTHVDGRTIQVKDMFMENMLLMNLFEQPIEIKNIIQDTIKEGMTNTGNYSHFHFLKFCGKYQLKKVAEQAEQFVTLLNN